MVQQAIQHGGDGDDSILGDSFANLLDGGNGNDTLSGAGDNDTLIGGTGTDWASYANAASGVTVNLGTGRSSGGDGNDSLTGVEAVLGSNFSDTLISGNRSFETLSGSGGADSVVGGLEEQSR